LFAFIFLDSVCLLVLVRNTGSVCSYLIFVYIVRRSFLYIILVLVQLVRIYVYIFLMRYILNLEK